MAVIETNAQTSVKLVYQVEDAEGEIRNTSKTFSNILDSADNDALYSGVSAVAGLLDDVAAQIIRVDQSELVSE